MELVEVYSVDEVWLRVECSHGVANELTSYFSFYAPNYKFHPKYRSGRWDGKIYLFNKRSSQIYKGLKTDIKEYCDRNNYKFVDNTKRKDYKVSDEKFAEFIASLNLPFQPYDFQLAAVRRVIDMQRGICLSPTSSGKSLIQYLICMFFSNKKFLVIVPSTGLVGQLATDFREYGYKDYVYQIAAGADKDNIDERITISTWQSIKDLPQKWFDQFDAIMGDEVHTFAAKSLISIMTKSVRQDIRIGLSGTLQEEEGTQITLRGLFGPIFRTTTTRELIDNKQAAELNIIGIELEYPAEIIKDFKQKKLDYPGEVDYITTYIPRQRFIANLARSLPGNKLILFKKIEHGKAIFKLLHETDPTKVHFIYGKVDADVRNEIRAIMEQNDGITVVASFKTFATGTNIKNLQYMIFGENTKSIITVLQAVGRALRKSETKTEATIFDIGDSIVRTKSKQNYAWQHFVKRIEYYTKEKFKVSIKKYKLAI